MKGTFFQKPLEFRLLVEGESWNQGDPIAGSLSVMNHGAEEISHHEIAIFLACGELGKVRLKSPDAFRVIDVVPMESNRKNFNWKFPTDRNCPITDQFSSLFLLYGRGKDLPALGQIQLSVQPARLIQDFLNILQIHFRFVLKTQKTNKNCVESKFAPPSAKAFAAVEKLTLSCRFNEDEFETRYVFNVKMIDASSGGMNMKKQKKEFQQSFTPAQYRLSSGRMNHDFMENSIKEVLGRLGFGVGF